MKKPQAVAPTAVTLHNNSDDRRAELMAVRPRCDTRQREGGITCANEQHGESIPESGDRCQNDHDVSSISMLLRLVFNDGVRADVAEYARVGFIVEREAVVDVDPALPDIGKTLDALDPQ